MIKISPYHEIFLNEWKLNPRRSDYNILFDQEIKTKIYPRRLKNALQRMVNDHVILHSRLKEINGNFFWEPNQNISVRLDNFKKSIDNTEIQTYVKSPFNLETGPLIRCGLIRLSQSYYRILIVIHHIVIDGAKGDFFIDQVSKYYNDQQYSTQLSRAEQCEKLTELNHRLETRISANKTNDRNFWDAKIKDKRGIDLTFLKPSFQPKQNNEILVEKFFFGKSILNQLKQLQKKMGVTDYLYSKAVFVCLLCRYANQESIAISYPISIHEGAEFIYGAHINAIISSYQIHSDITFSQILEMVKQDLKEVKLNKHHYCPIHEVISLEPSIAGALDVSFIQTNLKNRKLSINGITVHRINEAINVDLIGKLSFEQELKNDALNFKVKYASQFVDSKLLENFINTYKKNFTTLLSNLLNNVETKIAELEIVPEDQFQLMVSDLNNNQQEFEDKKTIHQCFEDQVLKTPQNIAVIYKSTELTYAELNKKSNQLAHFITDQFHPKPDDLIALCIDRSEYLLIAVLAVLKSGAAYVPITAEYPDERISFLLEDTQPKTVIVSKKYKQKILALQIVPDRKVIPIDDPATSVLLEIQSESNPLNETQSHHLAYVIYTSGTTGKPKGAMLEHKGIVNRINWMNKSFPLTEKDKILQKTPYVFDVSVWELFWANWHGASIVFADPDKHRDADYIADSINKFQISVVHFTPPMLDVFEETLLYRKETAPLPTLKYIFCSGEALHLDSVKRCHQLLPDTEIHNLYGPTEASIDVLHFDCTAKSIQTVYIGKPIDNTIIYILDSHLSLMPIGAVGELYVGGVGVARGYLNRAELTDDRFITNPFKYKSPNNPSSILYKTGDLVRMVADGNVEYLGRNDNQIKIRGNRVELGEVQTALISHPQIKQAIVLADNADDQKSNSHIYLVAYYVSDKKIEESAIQCHLAKKLPVFMIPRIYVHIEHIPLTVNGKIDVKALPKTTLGSHEYHPPVNTDQRYICDGFAQVLKVKKVGINDDFFMLGGNSILAVKLATRLQKNYKIILEDIYKLKTPKNIANTILPADETLTDDIENLCSFYTNKVIYASNDLVQTTIDAEINKYEGSNELKNKIDYQVKQITNILLTGATGHLGCHILNELLLRTTHKIYLLIRERSEELAFSKIRRKFEYYFNDDICKFKDRVVVLQSDISEKNLGLNFEDYQNLLSNIQSVIHCAALVKYYGQYEDFYNANILSTINIIEFIKASQCTDLHYISTVSILIGGYFPNEVAHIVDEDDDLTNFVSGNNFYNLSKLKAEQLVVDCRKDGIDCNVYRVGNLGMNSQTLRLQENISDNVFFNHLKTIIDIGIVPKEFSVVEISPVNFAASAIVKLFDKVETTNRFFHIFNSQLCNMTEMLNEFANLKPREAPMSEFIACVLEKIEDSEESMRNNLSLLHQIWRHESKEIHSTKIRISQVKTESILNQLGFFWPRITVNMLLPFVEQSNRI